MDAAAYLAHLQALLPPGQAWTREPDALMTRLLATLADALARVDARAAALLEEADPRTTLELLPEWEAMAGLPDPCTGPADGLAARRRRLVATLRMRGGQSRAYFIALADALGFPNCTIAEFRPFDAGSGCAAPLNTVEAGWPHVWRLDIPYGAGTDEFLTTSGCDEALRSWGAAALECAIRRVAPAHTVVQFGYVCDALLTRDGADILARDGTTLTWRYR